MLIIGASGELRRDQLIALEDGRFFTEYEVDRRRKVVVLGNAPGETLFPDSRSDRQAGARRRGRVHRRRRLRQAAEPARRHQPDEFAVIPRTTWQKIYGADALRIFASST